MDQLENIKSWRNNAVGYIQINRPEKANAYNNNMLYSFESSLCKQEMDDEILAVVICGTGKRSFCSGADLDEMRGKDFRSALDLKSARVFTKISSCKKVTLAAINGAAVGGGLELALACDLRIAAENARFFFPEPTIGLIPAAGGTQRLPKIVGIAKAKEMILGGKIWDAADAHRWGLVNEVVHFDDLLFRAQQWAEQIAQRDPVALRLAKMAIDPDPGNIMGSNFEAVAEALLYQLKSGK